MRAVTPPNKAEAQVQASHLAAPKLHSTFRPGAGGEAEPRKFVLKNVVLVRLLVQRPARSVRGARANNLRHPATSQLLSIQVPNYAPRLK